jgi:hypothetical protein
MDSRILLVLRNYNWKERVIGDTKERMERQGEGRCIKQNGESVDT